MPRQPAVRQSIPRTQNFFLRSEVFNVSPWEAMQGGSLLADAIPTSPLEGKGMTAMVENATNGRRYTGQVPNSYLLGKVVTFRVFAKKGARNYVLMFCNTGSALAWFNLNTGTVDAVSGGAIGRMVAQADGSYSCEITVTLTSLSALYIEAINVLGELGYQGVNNTQAIYITGAQAVVGSRPGDYVETEGVAVNTGNLRKLAVDRQAIPTQQNLFEYSEFSENEVGWYQYAATATPVESSNPLGTLVAEVVEDDTDDFHGIYQGFPSLTGEYGEIKPTLLVYFYAAVKKAVGRYVCVDLFLSLGDTFITVDLETGTVIDLFTTEEEGIITDFDGGLIPEEDGWYLVWITCKVRSDYPLNQMSGYVLNSSGEEGYNGIVYQGDGESSFLFGGANFAIADHMTLYKLTDGAVFDEGKVRSKIT